MAILFLYNQANNMSSIVEINPAKEQYYTAMDQYQGLVAEVGIVRSCLLGDKPGFRTLYIWNVLTEDFTPEQKAKIIDAIKKVLTELNAWEEKTWGDTIEDRNSQISYSALGQDVVANLGEEGVKLKEAWDPDNKKKAKIVEKLALLLPEFEVRAGGLTTIDVTKHGIDKAYGMSKLLKRLGLNKEEALFMGDRLKEGGNDYPVKAMGVDCIEVSSWEHTADEIEKLLDGTERT